MTSQVALIYLTNHLIISITLRFQITVNSFRQISQKSILFRIQIYYYITNIIPLIKLFIILVKQLLVYDFPPFDGVKVCFLKDHSIKFEDLY